MIAATMRRMIALPPCLPLAGCGTPPDADRQEGEPSVLVTLTRPTRGSLPQEIEAFGAATPATNGTETISMAQPGQITSLAVTPGSAVHAGQTLATFALAPTARSTFLQAQEAPAAQKQRASTAQLLAQQLATRDQLVQADKAVSDARVALAGLRAEGAGQAVQTLRAPFAGVVIAISAAQGDRTLPGAPIMTLARAGGIVVTVGVDPARRAALSVGQPARLAPLAGGAPIMGHVLRIDSTLNPRTRMIDVDLAFPTGVLLPGEGVQAMIATGQVSGWVVPHKAVVTADGPAHLFQAVGGKAKPCPCASRSPRTAAMWSKGRSIPRGRSSSMAPIRCRTASPSGRISRDRAAASPQSRAFVLSPWPWRWPG
jgi:RND family efflux transporter MFP subunit